jgi:ATP-dependent Clp protease ATP-binding subunit ClpA
MVSGDVVNVAARLQQGASPGDVLVGERTYAATSRVVTYGERTENAARGKSEPIPAWVALSAPLEATSRSARLTAPFIGREQEIAVLEAVASRIAREHVPQLVTLFGAAGVGKSRLLTEVLDRVDGARLLRGRCLPYGATSERWADAISPC